MKNNIKEFCKFMQNRIDTLQKKDCSNCAGTALYIVGELEKDEYISRIHYKNKLESLDLTNSIQIGLLIAWHDKSKTSEHIGVIVNTNPLLIANRRGRHGYFEPHETLKEINETYNRITTKIKYYIPSKLSQIINYSLSLTT